MSNLGTQYPEPLVTEDEDSEKQFGKCCNLIWERVNRNQLYDKVPYCKDIPMDEALATIVDESREWEFAVRHVQGGVIGGNRLRVIIKQFYMECEAVYKAWLHGVPRAFNPAASGELAKALEAEHVYVVSSSEAVERMADPYVPPLMEPDEA